MKKTKIEDSLTSAKNEKRRNRLKNMPSSFRGMYKKAIKGTSRKAAMIAQCSECAGYSRTVVRECADYGCPLWELRPYQSNEEIEEEKEV